MIWRLLDNLLWQFGIVRKSQYMKLYGLHSAVCDVVKQREKELDNVCNTEEADLFI